MTRFLLYAVLVTGLWMGALAAEVKAQAQSEDRARFYEAWGLDPVDPQALTDFGTLMANSGQVEEGRRYYSLALEQAPDFREALYGAAVLDLESGKVIEGVVALRRLSRSQDEFGARAHHQLARQSARDGFPEEAMSHFLQAHEAMPGNLEIGLDLATALLRRERYTEARDLAGELTAANPGSAYGYVIQGRALAGLGENQASRESFEMALVQNPQEPSALFELASLAEKSGHLAEADALYRSTIDAASSRGEKELARRARRALRGLGPR